MKKLIGVVASLVIGLVATATGAQAREGRLQLSNSNVSCEGVSIWRESSYRITGRCQGLVYPYETQADHYVLWAMLDNGNYIRIDDVDRGYFEGSIANSFTNIVITAEGSSSPRRPSTTEVVAGRIAPFDFDKSETTTTTPVATPTPAPKTGGITVQNGTNAATQSSVTVGSVVGRILRALLIIVGVIILVAVVASLLFRRRGSVSA